MKKDESKIIYKKLNGLLPVNDIVPKNGIFYVHKFYFDIKTQNEVSVIIPTFNFPEYLKECLDSVIIASQKLKNVEVLVGIDNCQKTLDYINQNEFSDNIKFFFFDENLGPYVIKNTLANFSNSKALFFFDSDDIMDENIIIECLSKLSEFKCIKPMYHNFYGSFDDNTIDKKSKPNQHGEGVFMIEKELFMKFNGFEPWRCAADSDFMVRMQMNRIKCLHEKNGFFYRRRHSESITQKKETNFGSKLRSHYANIIKTKKYWGPLDKLHINKCFLIKKDGLNEIVPNQYFYLNDWATNTKVDLEKIIQERKDKILDNFKNYKKEYTEEEKQEIIQKRKEFLTNLNLYNPKFTSKRIKGVRPIVGKNGMRGKNNFNP